MRKSWKTVERMMHREYCKKQCGDNKALFHQMIRNTNREESKRKIYGMLKDYIDAKDVINNGNDLYKYMNVNNFNNDYFDIKNAHPLIDNKIANFKNLTEYDYKLLKEYKNVDKYIFNIKGNEDEKRK